MQAKDIFIANNYKKDADKLIPEGVRLRKKDGEYNTNKFINALDYSLDLIQLRKKYEKTYRNKRFSFTDDFKEYTKYVINVNFDYNVNTFNKVNKNTYVRIGYSPDNIELTDCVYIQNGELIAIKVNEIVNNPVHKHLLSNNFYLENGKYMSKAETHVHKTVAMLRSELYTKGFWCDGTHYVRFKRSSGSSRIGKCLFIDEKLYSSMHKYELCGLKIKENQELDLAAFEAYRSLSLSSIIDTIEIQPENILVIDDYKSVFKDTVAVTELNNGHLNTTEKEISITNSIWDGQSLMDISIFGKYKDRGMLLLRNRFFKSCCFNCNVQKWFADNGIKEIKQLNGFTLAQKIADVKLITTPSSIKYLKFGTLKQWLGKIDKAFGVVKYDKPSHHFHGEMVESHYQLLNTLQLNENEVSALLEPYLNYIEYIKREPAVLRDHIKYNYGFIDNLNGQDQNILNKQAVIYSMLGISDEFSKTKLYKDFRNDLVRSLIKRIRRGHVLINGNYSTMIGNPVEMLQASIGKFNGISQIGIGNIYSTRFNFNKTLLGSRSPHICAGNILLTENKHNDLIKMYFNFTPQIVAVNAIGENIQQRLNGCDYDSDSILLTDNSVLIKAARKNQGRFLVPTANLPSLKINRTYHPEQQTELDIKTSVNKIGEIVNLSQELNTALWQNIYEGVSEKENRALYGDICTLAVLSGVEIDAAKREYTINTTEEIKRIKNKYSFKDTKIEKNIKPYFFKFISQYKGLCDTNKNDYRFSHCTMDILEKVINKFSLYTDIEPPLKLSGVLVQNQYDSKKIKYEQIKKIILIMRKTRTDINNIWHSLCNEKDDTKIVKWQQTEELRLKASALIYKIKLSDATMYRLLQLIDQPEYSDISRSLFNILFSYPDKRFLSFLKQSRSTVGTLKRSKSGNIKLFSNNYQIIKT